MPTNASEWAIAAIADRTGITRSEVERILAEMQVKFDLNAIDALEALKTLDIFPKLTNAQ